VPDRDGLVRRLGRDGIELGNLIQYSVPHLPEYGAAPPSQFPRSFHCSTHTINLPVHPGLTDADRERVVSKLLASRDLAAA
jgi:dTDP-4-amino-4,6-dideoxygalactose transaminase